jgi:hypothetical protein
MTLKFQAIIKKDGKVVTEVLERGKHLCSEVYKVTNSVGRQLSDEETGPEGDSVHEVSRA